MSIDNYGELQTAISNYLQRDDLTSRIPEFIALAEDRIAQDERLRLRAMETSTDLTVNAQTVSLPTGFLAARRLYLSTNPIRVLDYLAPIDFWQRYLSTTAGTPYAYTIEGDNLVFGPSPDTTYTGKFLYHKRFTALSDDADTNWIFSNARGLLLYASMLEASLYLEDDINAQKWSMLYDDAAERAMKANRKDRYPAGNLVARGVRGV